MDIITLTTDFGDSEGFTGAMKGKILSTLKKYNKDAKIIDITHNIKPFNIYHCAYVLLEFVPFFPEAVHIAVVDPTVGSKRRSIVIETNKGFLVGPDNGIFSYVTDILKIKKIYLIDEKKYTPSNTFHGRDIYAVVGAELISGVFEGIEINDFVKFDNSIKKVIHIDRFGNIITNVKENEINFNYGDIITIKFITKTGIKKIKCKFVKSYFEEKEGFLCLINSEGFLEIAKFMDNAAKYLEVDYLDRVEII